MKKKTSISLSDEARASIKRLAAAEQRTISNVLDIFVVACGRLSEDAAHYGKTVKDIANEIERIGDRMKKKGNQD
jgi:hypothetical protein